jgi:Protein of unknown function (DUF2948)
MDTHELKPLKLIAKDLEDLQILAAHLQDSILPFMSMQYDPETKTFRALANRFCWEHGEMDAEGTPLYHRVHSGLEIHNVNRVLQKGFNRDNQDYTLLTMHGEPEGAIHLVFSGGSEVRLETEDIHLRLGDVQHPWPTRKKPKHIHDHLKELEQEGPIKAN